MSEKCAWCEFLKDSHEKKYKTDINPKETFQCPDCGAWSDIGQATLKVNSYADIYRGCVRLMHRLMSDVEEFLQANYPDELEDMLENYGDNGYDDEETKEKKLIWDYYTSEILRELFMPYCGGTKTNNMHTVLGIEEEYVEFSIGKEQEEEYEE